MKPHATRVMALAVLLCALNALFPANKLNAQDLTSDSLALVALYNATDGLNWDNNDNWLTGPVDTWYGVNTSSVTQRVTNILLTNNNLSGTLPPEISSLTEMEIFHVQLNNLSGSIPPEIGDMDSLYYLNLSRNFFGGSIPNTLYTLEKLTSLILNQNNLIGTISDSVSLLEGIQAIEIWGNQLSGSVPNTLTSLSSLQVLDIRNNNFENLPDLSGISNLTQLFMSNNLFHFDDIEPNVGISTIIYSPQNQFGDEVNVEVADGGNFTIDRTAGGSANSYQWYKDDVIVPGETNPVLSLTNVTPSDAGLYEVRVTNAIAPSLTLFSNAINLTVSNSGLTQDSLALVALYNSTDGPNWTNNINWLTGPVSSWQGVGLTIGNGRVRQLVLQGNNLSGTLPPEIGDLTAMEVIFIGNNNISGTIPEEVSGMVNLTAFSASGNSLTGVVPEGLLSLPEIQSIALYGNSLSALPGNIGPADNLELLFLEFNQLEGEIPNSINSLTSLTSLRLNDNGLIDGIPDLSGLPDLEFLSVSGNRLVFDDLEPNIGITTYQFWPQDSALQSVDVSSEAGLEVILDRTLGGSANVYEWYKDGLLIPGETGPTLTLSSVQSSDAGVYHAQATSPLLPNLEIITRPITLNISGSANIESDSLALVALYNATDGPNWDNNDNWLTGPLDTWYGIIVASFPSRRVTNVNLNYNNLDGFLPSEIGDLTEVQSLNLQGNYNLSGTVPWEIGNLESVVSISLDFNQLTGPIPSSIYTLPNIQYISFFDSDLTGSISDSISMATNLISFQVDQNNLSGSVPTSITTLSSLEVFSAIHNELDELPDMSTMPSITNVTVNSNRLTFEDLEENIGIQYFNYSPQDSIGVAIDTIADLGTTLTFDGTIGGTANQYQWFKDGVSLPGQNSSALNIASFTNEDVGAYHVEVTNSIATDLTIYGRPINISSSNPPPTPLELDSLALVALYNATDGPNWTNSDNWLTGPLDTWHGVWTNGSRVYRLEVWGNNLSGTLPPEMANLTFMSNMSLSENNLTGPIPPEIEAMESIYQLYLGGNNFTGPIPNFIYNLTNLSALMLYRNDLSGQISDSIGQLTNLGYVDFSGNDFTGAIPDTMASLQNLIILQANDTRLEDLPDFSGIPDMDFLYVARSKFTFEDLEPNVGFTYTSFSPQDSVGESIDTVLTTGDNFTIDRTVGGSANVYQWYKDGGPVSGQTGPVLSLTNVTAADAGLYHLEVTNTIVTDLTIYSNEINVGVDVPNLSPFESDSLALVAIYNATDGPNWNNNDNWLTGPLDSWYGITLSFDDRVQYIGLNGNNLTGTLPPEIGDLNEVVGLNMATNNLTGTIPAEMGLMYELTTLYLNDNSFSGNLPVELGDIPLGYINLNTNNLSGTLPEFLYTSDLNSLLLAYNSFEGELTANIANAINLTYLDLGFNNLVGNVPDEILTLNQLQTLYIGGNSFVDIPDVSTMPNLNNGLYVFFNRFTFEDLEPFVGMFNLLYFGQAKVGEPVDTLLTEGSSISIDREIGGSANLYQWYRNGVAVPGQTSSTLNITSATIADTGTYVLQVSNTIITDLIIESENVVIRMNVTGCQGNYTLTESDVTCASPFFNVPITAGNAVGNGIIGLNFCVTYDTTMMSPTGDAMIGDVVHGGDASIADYYLNTSVPGTVEGLIYFKGSAPFPSYFSGSGDIITLEFEYDPDVIPGDQLALQLCGVTESTLTAGDSVHCNESEFIFTVTNEATFVGTLEYWNKGNKYIPYDASNPGYYIPTTITGTDADCNVTGADYNPDLLGQFTYDINEGEHISIFRDIPGSFEDTTGCTNMMQWINGTDQNRTMKIATNDASYTPNVYAILAADVNHDGQVNAADVTLIAARSVMNICGFTQDGVTSTDDWLFIDETTLDADPQYQISATYPADDGVGFSRSKVPTVADCLPVPASTTGACTETFDETYIGVMLGDVNGNWKTVDGTDARTEEDAFLAFDFDNMYEEGGSYYLRMVVQPSEMEAFDFFFSYNQQKIEIEDVTFGSSAFDVTSNVYNNYFLYSSYAMEPTTIEGPFMTLQLNASAPPSPEDFVQGTVYMDDEPSVIANDADEIEIELESETWLIFPNPFDDYLMIQYFGNGDKSMELNIYNTAGKKVYGSGKTTGEEIGRKLELDIKPGVYFLEIMGGGERQVRKLIKE